MFKWNAEKNKWLLQKRNISFEEIVQAISDGYGVSDVPHWNQEKYPNQRIITVIINEYAYLVPYVKDGDGYFLKTIIPSRKATRKYKEERR